MLASFIEMFRTSLPRAEGHWHRTAGRYQEGQGQEALDQPFHQMNHACHPGFPRDDFNW